MCKKKILVAVENFSGFVITQFSKSEKHSDLLEALIQAVYPFKSSSLSSIRVDQAPGFRKLISKNEDLSRMGIKLVPGEAKNDNALSICDKKMQELEREIKKTAPSNNVISLHILAKATATVNEKVRNQGLSAKEIIFSRDQFSNKNLEISDEVFANKVMEDRNINNLYSSKSKSTHGKEALPANAVKGDLVFLKHDGDKLSRRDMYLVTDTDDDKDVVTVCKISKAFSNEPASFQPHNYLYKVKQTEIYKAPNQPTVLEIDQYYPQVHHEYWPPPYSPVPRHHHEPPVYQHSTPPKSREYFQKHSNWSFDVIQDDTLLRDVEGPHSDDELVHEIDEDPEAQDNTSEITIDDAIYLAMMNSPRITSEEESDDTTDQEEIGESESGDTENIENFSANESEENLELSGEEETLSNIDNQSDPENDHEDDLFNLNAPNPLLFPNVGEDILFLDKEAKPNPRIVKAQILPMFKTVQRRWPGWFNVRREDNNQGSVNLHSTRWRIRQTNVNLSVSISPRQSCNLEDIDLDSHDGD